MTSPGKKRNEHPAEEILADLAENRGSPALRAELRGHLKACGRCGKRFEAITTLLSRLEGGRLESPPDWLSAWASDLPRSHPKRVAKAVRGTLRLIFDSLALSPAGARSHTTRPRRLVFRQGQVDVDLEIEVRPGGSLGLRGQILDASVPGGRLFQSGTVVMKKGRSIAARAPLSDRGLFQIPSIDPGTYSLRVEARGFDCRVPALEI